MTESEAGEFRVRVSLERYFSDERARCYMSVAGGRAVRWLARRLRRTFGIPRPFALLCRGHLLPPAEPLALLHHDDPVEVIPTKYVMPKAEADNDHNSTSGEMTFRCSGAAVSPLRCASPSVEGSPPPAAAEESGDTLADVKRRALDLLDQYSCGEGVRRRRRVRRRRVRGPPPAGAPAPALLHNGAPAPAVLHNGAPAPAVLHNGAPAPAVLHNGAPAPAVLHNGAPAPAVLHNGAPAPAVLHNRVAGPRPPRLVRALPSPALDLPPHFTSTTTDFNE